MLESSELECTIGLNAKSVRLHHQLAGQSRRIKVESGPCSMIFPDSQIENERKVSI